MLVNPGKAQANPVSKQFIYYMLKPNVTKVFRKFERNTFHGFANKVFQSFLTSLEFFQELSENSQMICRKFVIENYCNFC